ncbi:MAG: Holliday junction resolvase RuvX [Legionellales bacterium]|nr:Holliday junction resolvase RuvX [Legionellales bacterium]
MPDGVYLGFDFGYRRIGVSVGQMLTHSASPLSTLAAVSGVPRWEMIAALLAEWQPQALIVGIPTHIDDSEQYTTAAARGFARQLRKRFALPVHLVDERLTTVEARAYLFEQGGYRHIKKAEIDSIAACVILEQWLQGGPR